METFSTALVCRWPAIAGLLAVSVLPVRAATLWVGDGSDGSIKRYDTITGSLLGSAAGPGAFSPGGMAFGPDGNLYVADVGNSAVQRFNGATGQYDAEVVQSISFVPLSSGGLVLPTSLAFGPDGNLYVSNPTGTGGVVSRYNGTTFSFIDQFITTDVTGPGNLIFDATGNLYVADPASFNSTGVLRFNSSGALDYGVPSGSGPPPVFGMAIPNGLAIGPDGNLYVAEEGNGSATVYRINSTNGAFLNAFIPNGPYSPIDGKFGPDGFYYLTDGINGITRFSFDGPTNSGTFHDTLVPLFGAGGLVAPEFVAFSPESGVPEPASFALIAAGCVALALGRRLRN